MATVKVKFRPSSVITKEGTLYYQITHNRVVKQINTGYKLYPTEWSSFASKIVVPPNAEESRYHYLLALQNSLKKETARLAEIIVRLNRTNSTYTADRIVELYNLRSDDDSFLLFTRNLIVQLKQIGKVRTAETYTCALNSFIRFQGETDLFWEAVDSNLMMEYEVYLKAEGVCPNTSSYYMRGLRAIYNRAVEKELTIQRYPFKHVYTGIDKTVKRAVPLKAVKRIKVLDLMLKPHLDYARDMFLFSFYTRGMSFIDMAYLKKSDLKNGILTYRRRKTGQQLTIKWEKCMEEIVNKYKGRSATQYLLPIITNPFANERVQYTNALSRVNVTLKEVARLVDLQIPLTMYCARHGWASVAKSKNIPLSVISDGMGHDSEETTRIYLASLDTSVVDRANSLILKDL